MPVCKFPADDPNGGGGAPTNWTVYRLISGKATISTAVNPQTLTGKASIFTSGSSSATNLNTLSQSVVIGSSNVTLVVMISLRSDDNPTERRTITSVAYGSAPLILGRSDDSGDLGAQGTAIYYLFNPAVGTDNLVITTNDTVQRLRVGYACLPGFTAVDFLDAHNGVVDFEQYYCATAITTITSGAYVFGVISAGDVLSLPSGRELWKIEDAGSHGANSAGMMIGPIIPSTRVVSWNQDTPQDYAISAVAFAQKQLPGVKFGYLSAASRFGTTTTRTLTGKGRIRVSTSKTLTGKARVSGITSRTLTGLANIVSLSLRTLTGVTNIRNTSTQTITAKARVGLVTSQTLSGLSRIQLITTQILAGISRLTQVVSVQLNGVARMTATSDQTLVGLTRITVLTSQTLPGLARLVQAVSATLSGVARIQTSNTATLTGLGAVLLTRTTNLTGTSRIQTQVSQTLQGVARVKTTVDQQLTGLSRITQVVPVTLTGKGFIVSVTISTQRTLTGIARIASVVVVADPDVVMIDSEPYFRTGNNQYQGF